VPKKEVCGSEGVAYEITTKQDLAEEKRELIERRRQKMNRRLDRTNLTDKQKETVRRKLGL